MAKGPGTKTDRLTSAARKQRGSHWTGQDTVLALLFDALQPTNRYFVEFGFNTNSYAPGQNTEKLWQAGWRGLLLDGGHANASINLQQEFIKSTNIVELFRKHGVPLEPDYVSVDMDSADLWVVDAMLGTYKPRVYSVEYNPNYPWRFAYTYPDAAQWDPEFKPDRVHYGLNGEDKPSNHGCYVGASARAMDLVAKRHGYTLAAVVKPSDMFFVRDDVLWRSPQGLALRSSSESTT